MYLPAFFFFLAFGTLDLAFDQKKKDLHSLSQEGGMRKSYLFTLVHKPTAFSLSTFMKCSRKKLNSEILLLLIALC